MRLDVDAERKRQKRLFRQLAKHVDAAGAPALRELAESVGKLDHGIEVLFDECRTLRDEHDRITTLAALTPFSLTVN